MSDMPALIDRGKKVLVGNYARIPIAMARGEGALVWDQTGKRYIDLFAGFGGAILGHCHPALVEAATAQAKKLWHVGNTFYTEPQIEVAERLNKTAFAGHAFFCHSGLEANEAACKLARLRGRSSAPNRWKVITFLKSFHGRSLAMISATGNPKVKAGFDPMVPGFINIEPNDIALLEKSIDAETAAIMLEPVQGEGGVNLFSSEFVQKVRELCDRLGLTLIFDEVWTGCGRTGRWFAHQHFRDASGRGIEPDIMTLGKALGGGVPVGAMYAKPAIAELLGPGKHGCTLGGNPVCVSASRAVFDVIEREKLTDHAAVLGEHAVARLRNETKLRDK